MCRADPHPDARGRASARRHPAATEGPARRPGAPATRRSTGRSRLHLRRRLPVAQTGQEGLDVRGMLHRAIGTERDLGRHAQIQVAPQPVPDEAARALEGLKRRRPLRLLAEHGHIHFRVFEIGRHVDLRHRHEAEARILELALKEHGDLLLDQLVHALEPLALHHRTSTWMSVTYPSTWSSMKSIALEMTSFAWRASTDTQASARVARCQESWWSTSATEIS